MSDFYVDDTDFTTPVEDDDGSNQDGFDAVEHYYFYLGQDAQQYGAEAEYLSQFYGFVKELHDKVASAVSSGNGTISRGDWQPYSDSSAHVEVVNDFFDNIFQGQDTVSVEAVLQNPNFETATNVYNQLDSAYEFATGWNDLGSVESLNQSLEASGTRLGAYVDEINDRLEIPDEFDADFNAWLSAELSGEQATLPAPLFNHISDTNHDWVNDLHGFMGEMGNWQQFDVSTLPDDGDETNAVGEVLNGDAGAEQIAAEGQIVQSILDTILSSDIHSQIYRPPDTGNPAIDDFIQQIFGDHWITSGAAILDRNDVFSDWLQTNRPEDYQTISDINDNRQVAPTNESTDADVTTDTNNDVVVTDVDVTTLPAGGGDTTTTTTTNNDSTTLPAGSTNEGEGMPDQNTNTDDPAWDDQNTLDFFLQGLMAVFGGGGASMSQNQASILNNVIKELIGDISVTGGDQTIGDTTATTGDQTIGDTTATTGDQTTDVAIGDTTISPDLSNAIGDYIATIGDQTAQIGDVKSGDVDVRDLIGDIQGSESTATVGDLSTGDVTVGDTTTGDVTSDIDLDTTFGDTSAAVGDVTGVSGDITIDPTLTTEIGDFTTEIGDLSTGASTSTIGDVTGASIGDISTAGTVGDVTGASIQEGAVSNVISDLISSPIFAEGAFDINDLISEGAVTSTGGAGGTSTIESGAISNAPVFTDAVNLENMISAPLLGENAVQGGSATINEGAITNAPVFTDAVNLSDIIAEGAITSSGGAGGSVGNLSTGASTATGGNIESGAISNAPVFTDAVNLSDMIAEGAITSSGGAGGLGGAGGSVGDISTAGTVGNLSTGASTATGGNIETGAVNISDLISSPIFADGAFEIGDLIGDISTAGTVGDISTAGTVGDIKVDTAGTVGDISTAGTVGDIKNLVGDISTAGTVGDIQVDTAGTVGDIKNLVGDISTAGTVGDISTEGTVGDVNANIEKGAVTISDLISSPIFADGAFNIQDLVGPISTAGTVGDISTAGTVGNISIDNSGIGTGMEAQAAAQQGAYQTLTDSVTQQLMAQQAANEGAQSTMGNFGSSVIDFLGNFVGGQNQQSENSLAGILADAAAQEYAANAFEDASANELDFQKQIYDDALARQQPFYDLGVTSAMEVMPDYVEASKRDVIYDDFDPFDTEDPALRFLQDEQRRAIENSSAARGRLNSGGTLTDLQDRAANVALTRAGELGNIRQMMNDETRTRDAYDLQKLDDLITRSQNSANVMSGQGSTYADQGGSILENLGSFQYNNQVDRNTNYKNILRQLFGI